MIRNYREAELDKSLEVDFVGRAKTRSSYRIITKAEMRKASVVNPKT
jgi:hypothetical protein